MVHSTSVPKPCPTLLAAGLLSLALLAPNAQAQPGQPVGKPDPLDPQARVPAWRYESSLKATKPAASEAAISWREANDTVTRIGGWRAYAREAQPITPVPAAAGPAASTPRPSAEPAAVAPKPAPGSRQGHHHP